MSPLYLQKCDLTHFVDIALLTKESKMYMAIIFAENIYFKINESRVWRLTAFDCKMRLQKY